MNRTDRLVYRVARLEQALKTLADVSERVVKCSPGAQEEKVLREWLAKETAAARLEIEAGKEKEVAGA